MNERPKHTNKSRFKHLNHTEWAAMNELLELQEKATKLVHWPTGITYSCDHHAEALKKIASSMRIHIAIENYIAGEMLCANCLNESSIAKGDADE
ncbi:MAG: hypothetical protein LJE92_15785 [Gammaproteobacteria bacterium]|jgi:hypothetical protein|nr:hypothetical protein [Gammaproteobacteria bacterium]